MKLTLIGAGPGDPELITLKAVKALRQAKVVLYDALVHPDILEHCSPDCVKIHVGKRFGKQSCKQEEINRMIVEYALRYEEIVRLKGGDSYIFGRGFEEIEYAARHGIRSEVIPGLSSSYSVPALVGIPLTSRGVSESFWVVTGTTKEHELSSDLELAARSSATVVILMGMHKLEVIAEIYAAQGKSETPVAIIQNGSLPNQKIVRGNLRTILSLAREQEMASPSVIVIGQVVALNNLLEEITGTNISTVTITS